MTTSEQVSGAKPARDERLVWVSVATTSVDPAEASLLEVALVITDNDLAVIAEVPETVVSSEAVVSSESVVSSGSMDAVTRSRHERTGLLARIPEVGVSLEVAEASMLKLLEAHGQSGSMPLCGHEVWKARTVLRRCMPKLVDYLHYRLVELTTIEALSERWYPDGPTPLDLEIEQSPMRCHDDVRRTIERLKAYREQVMRGVAEEPPTARSSSGDQA